MWYVVIIIIFLLLLCIIYALKSKIQHFTQVSLCAGVPLPRLPGYIFTYNSSGVISAKCDTANGYSGTSIGPRVRGGCRGPTHG